MKVILASQQDISRFFKSKDSELTDQLIPYHTVHIMANDSVDNFIAKKLQSGFQCVILEARQLAFNELVPKTITI